MGIQVAEPLVSITMPVFNSVSRMLNGEILLRRSIESLLRQTHRNVSLIILDNQSDDGTFAVCEEYSKRDSRVRLIRDSVRRPPADAGDHLLSFVQSEFLMHACDDDEWDSSYIEKCLAVIKEHPEIALVYTNFQYIDTDNNVIGKPAIHEGIAYTKEWNAFGHACRYFVQRTPVPILLGIFRTEAYRNIQPFIEFDLDWKANADNLFIFRYFARGYRSHYIDESLFYYRVRDRSTRESERLDPISSWLRYVKHQLVFRDAALKEFFHPSAMKLSETEAVLMRATINHGFLLHTLNLLTHVVKEETPADDIRGGDAVRRLELLRKILVPEMDSLWDPVKREVYEYQKDDPAVARKYFEFGLDLKQRTLELVRCARAILPKPNTPSTLMANQVIQKLELDLNLEMGDYFNLAKSI